MRLLREINSNNNTIYHGQSALLQSPNGNHKDHAAPHHCQLWRAVSSKPILFAESGEILDGWGTGMISSFLRDQGSWIKLRLPSSSGGLLRQARKGRSRRHSGTRGHLQYPLNPNSKWGCSPIRAGAGAQVSYQ